jgi:endonuclease III
MTMLLICTLLSSCTIDPHRMDMTQALQSAKSRSDHEALARHYQEAAKEMQAKAEEHKKLLAHYQAKKDLYRKQAQDLINHCQGLIRVYEQAAADNLAMAKSHREIAAETK